MRLDATSLIQCDDRSVARIRESVDIDALSERVWAVVAEDVTNAPKWTSNLDKVEKLDDGPPGRGTRYRYHLDLGGHKEKLEVEQTVYAKPTPGIIRCRDLDAKRNLVLHLHAAQGRLDPAGL